jgi:hypothetical protein
VRNSNDSETRLANESIDGLKDIHNQSIPIGNNNPHFLKSMTKRYPKANLHFQ